MKMSANMGLFGHIPTPDEVNAKAFAMDRRAQPEGMWPGYVMGLRDSGLVDDQYANTLLMAACHGQVAHNADPLFDYEIEGCEEGE